jgi:hypothetical protein
LRSASTTCVSSFLKVHTQVVISAHCMGDTVTATTQ